MKFLIPVFISAFFLVACERIEGLVTVLKDVKLKNSKGDIQLIRVGTYNADIKAKTSKKITLRLNNNSDEKFIFKHNGNIPESGTFTIPSNVSGQPVDLFGSIDTVVEKSDIKEARVSCSYEVPYQVCYPTPRGSVNCGVQTRIVYGNQWIRYYEVVSTKNVDLIIKTTNNNEVVGDFCGEIVDNQRTIINQSICH